MRARIAGAIMGAAALCLFAGAAQAQSERPPVPEAWGTAGSYGQQYRRPPVYDYGQPGRAWDYGYSRSSGGHRHGGDSGVYRPPVRQGYRDTWGYNDDRPHTARGHGRDSRHRDGHYDGCGCPDVYLYDR
jgi:hypothetical protein